MDLSAFREEYLKDTLHRKDLAETPFEQFDRWFKQAMESGYTRAQCHEHSHGHG